MKRFTESLRPINESLVAIAVLSAIVGSVAADYMQYKAEVAGNKLTGKRNKSDWDDDSRGGKDRDKWTNKDYQKEIERLQKEMARNNMALGIAAKDANEKDKEDAKKVSEAMERMLEGKQTEEDIALLKQHQKKLKDFSKDDVKEVTDKVKKISDDDVDEYIKKKQIKLEPPIPKEAEEEYKTDDELKQELIAKYKEKEADKIPDDFKTDGKYDKSKINALSGEDLKKAVQTAGIKATKPKNEPKPEPEPKGGGDDDKEEDVDLEDDVKLLARKNERGPGMVYTKVKNGETIEYLTKEDFMKLKKGKKKSKQEPKPEPKPEPTLEPKPKQTESLKIRYYIVNGMIFESSKKKDRASIINSRLAYLRWVLDRKSVV